MTRTTTSADDEYREPVTEAKTTRRRRLDHKRTDLREAPNFDVVQEEDDGGGAPDDEGSTTRPPLTGILLCIHRQQQHQEEQKI